MAESVLYVVPVEVREAADGPMLRGVVLQEGRAANGGRAELFTNFSVVWPSDGIALRGEHRGVELARAVPTRDADGSLRIETRATPAILTAYATRKFFSVEFHALAEVRTAGGVREIQRALLEAVALVPNPEYPNVRAEVRAQESEGVALMKWPWSRPESSQSASYTDQVISQHHGECNRGE